MRFLHRTRTDQAPDLRKELRMTTRNLQTVGYIRPLFLHRSVECEIREEV